MVGFVAELRADFWSRIIIYYQYCLQNINVWSNPCLQLPRKVTGLVATDALMPAEVFNFAGQAIVDDEDYDELMVNRYRLSLEAIRKCADEFSFWQRRRRTSRPPVRERDLLVAFLVRQLFDATFRGTEGLLVLLDDYFDLDEVPDHSRFMVGHRFIA